MFRDIEMYDLTSLVQKDDEAVKVTESCSRDGEEIDANDVAGVIGEESLPSLGGRLRRPGSVVGDGRFGYIKPKKLEFGLNTRSAPKRILL